MPNQRTNKGSVYIKSNFPFLLGGKKHTFAVYDFLSYKNKTVFTPVGVWWVHRDLFKSHKSNKGTRIRKKSQVRQLMKDLGVTSRLEAKSSLNRRCVIKARKVCSDSSNLLFVIVSGQLFGWKPQPK